MKKRFLLNSILIAISLISCNSKPNNSDNESFNISTNISVSENMNSNTSEYNTSYFEKDSNLIEDKLIIDFDEISLYSFEKNGKKYNESYYLGDEISSLNIKYVSANPNIVIAENGYFKAVGVGKTAIRLILDNYYKDIIVTVTENDSNATSFKFDKGSLKGKKLVVFGDSVSAQSTIGNGKTYSQLLEENMEMSSRNNFAIGGTTLTYTFFGSNIYKEYHKADGTLVVDDAVTNLSKHIDDCKDADYVFIAYGHNDQYYQQAIDNVDDLNDIFSLKNCESYKGSFRWIIRKLRDINPSVRIVVLNCTYSQYDLTKNTQYGTKYTYADYRQAAKEIAEGFACRYLDPWDYLKPYFGKVGYYQDSVHLTELGHKELYNFIINN